MKGVDRAEEMRVDEAAAEIEQRHQDEKTNLPAADELGRRAAAADTGFRGHQIELGLPRA